MNKIELGKIANIRTGKLDANASSEDGRYPFFTCSKEPLSINSYSYDCECVLVAGNGDLNVKYFNGKFDAYQRTYIIEAKDKSELSVKYLYNFIDSKMDFIRSQSIGGVIKYIKLGDLTSLKIPLPPLTTQQTISSELDLLNSLIDKQKAQLTELDRLAQSVFYDMFGDPVENEKGWNKGKLGDVCISVNYGTSSPATENGKYKYLRMNNITYNGELDLKDLKYIDVEEKDYEKYVVRKGDILFNRTNSKELVGKTTYFNKNEEMVIAGYLIRVRIIDTVLPIFVSKYLNTAYIKVYLKGLCKSIIGQANINAKELQSIPLYFPPLSLQQQFAEKIEAIEAQKALVKQSIAQSEQLLASRMQYYFE